VDRRRDYTSGYSTRALRVFLLRTTASQALTERY
jgi:hypothetical protein